MVELKRFNVKWKGGQLDRTIVEETEEKAREYMEKKYPNREIISVGEY